MPQFTLNTFQRLIRHSKTSLTEIETDLKRLNLTQSESRPDVIAIRESLANTYAEIQPRLEAYQDLEPLPQDLTEDILDDGILSIKSLHRRIFVDVEKYCACHPVTAPVTNQQTAPSNTTLVQLPKFDIQPFSGDFDQWPHFYARFESLIHNNPQLSKIQKLQYLLSLLAPSPRKAIEHFSITEANYDSALSCLKDRFHNPRRLVVFHAENLLKLPVFDSKSSITMRNFLDQFNSNFKSLQNIPDINVYESVFTTYVLSLLDPTTRSKFESSYEHPLQFPRLDDVITFLTSLVLQKENTSSVGSEQHSQKKIVNRRVSTLVTSPSTFKCPVCKSASHKISQCKGFLSQGPKQRLTVVRQCNLCTNCLGSHSFSDCASKYTCKTCSLKHHSLLHFGDPRNSTPHSQGSTVPTPISEGSSLQPHAANTSAALPASTPPGTPTGAAYATSISHGSNSILMSTCLVRIQTSHDNFIIVRAVLDTASHASFITEKCVQILNPRRYRHPVSVTGIGQTQTSSSGICNLSLATLRGDIVSDAQAFIIMSKITTHTPLVKISSAVRHAAQNYVLADPSFDVPSQIDVLLSADVTAAVMKGAPISLGHDMPFLIPTLFGYVVMGHAPVDRPACNLSCVQMHTSLPCDLVLSTSIHDDFHPDGASVIPALVTSQHDDLLSSVQRFWQIEEPPPVKPKLSDDDTLCEEFFRSSTTRDPDGRYIVRLPFKSNSTSLGNSYNCALRRLYSMERKFKTDPAFKEKYIEFMQDYEAQNHMKLAPPQAQVKYFIPHHGIFKQHDQNSKLRVVFDASSKSSSGISLNDLLYSGPKLQQLITDVLTLFRKYPSVFVTDIVQMFRQIKVHEHDQPYQCILWRESPSSPIKVYYLTTVTYGVSSSPFLALRTLKQLALDEGSNHPRAAQALRQTTFVDDIVAGADTVSGAIHLRDDLISLLAKGCFTLKKWSTNQPQILADMLCPELGDSSVNVSGPVRVLGLLWDTSTDSFSYDFASSWAVPPPDAQITKRSILSHIASIYDPCGWLSPVTMKAKSFLQRLWLYPLDWDSPLPTSLLQEWHSFTQSILSLHAVHVPRCLSLTGESFQLHGFSDASKTGYAAVLYLRSISDHPTVSLLAAKTRVTPLKTPTLPRLELMGAHLLANIAHHYLNLLTEQIKIDSLHLWSDSTIVLDWLKIPPMQLKTFVANRVAQILDWTEPSMWGHVPTHDNPADVASRGISPSQLSNHPLWWTGPDWLTKPTHSWPVRAFHPVATPVDELVPPSLTATVEIFPDLFSHLSSWPRLVRVVAKILEWGYKSKRLGSVPSLCSLYEQAFHQICYYIQFTSLQSIISSIKKGVVLPKPYQRLSPFLDSSGLVRVGGRVKSSSGSHPILLPKNHRLVTLLVDYYHEIFAHAGPAVIQSQLTKKVWILSARQLIRARVFACIRCFRSRPTNKPPFMGSLPIARVQPSPPFYHTGMDFAGPFSAKLHHLRKSPMVKVYLCIFICFSTKAVHMELVHDLSTTSFIDALRRFISRRSAPAQMYSDCGTNFTGAANVLNKEWQEFLRSASDLVIAFTASQGIEFNFNPPAAPHQGGLWERAVGLAKFHLTRILGTHTPTVSQLSSLFVRVEAVLNSRPLSPQSSDPTDLAVLTPAHFLVHRPMIAPPEPNIDIGHDLLNKHNLVQALIQQFWSRWKSEYLPLLQPRSKWTTNHPNLKVGDLVLLQEPNAPPLTWPLGRITQVFPASDGNVRKALVHTPKGDYLRPSVRLFPLPMQPLGNY